MYFLPKDFASNPKIICKNCVAYSAGDPGNADVPKAIILGHQIKNGAYNPAIGACLKEPPTLNVILAQVNGQVNPMAVSSFPVVNSMRKCGMFEPKKLDADGEIVDQDEALLEGAN